MVRMVMPDQFEQLLKQFQQEAGRAGVEPAATGASSRAAADQLRKLNLLELELDHGATGLRLAFTAAPLKLPEGPEAKLPDMPANCVARVDVSGALVQALPNDPNWARTLLNPDEKNPANKDESAMTPEMSAARAPSWNRGAPCGWATAASRWASKSWTIRRWSTSPRGTPSRWTSPPSSRSWSGRSMPPPPSGKRKSGWSSSPTTRARPRSSASSARRRASPRATWTSRSAAT